MEPAPIATAADPESIAQIAALQAEVAALRGRIADIETAQRRKRRRRRIVWAGLAATLVLLIALHHPLLVGYAYLFRVDNPAPSDALVLLLGGLERRPAKAAEMYRQGVASKVLMCVPPRREAAGDLLTAYRDKLIREGVPADAIVVLPDPVESTRDEAQRVRRYVEALNESQSPASPSATAPIRRLTLVTTAFHTSRARWIFRRTLGPEIDVRVAAAEDHRFNETNWYRGEDGLMSYFGETIRAVYYRWKH